MDNLWIAGGAVHVQHVNCAEPGEPTGTCDKPDEGSPGAGGDGGGAAVADQVDLGTLWRETLDELSDEIASRQQRA